MSLNSKQRRAADSKLVRNRVYADKGMGANPYEPDTRRHRMWAKEHASYWRCEAQMDDLALAYGEFRPDKMV
jgi:hypothetical protein